MNSITKFAVKYPVSVLMLTLAVCLLGTISYNKLGTDLFPDLKKMCIRDSINRVLLSFEVK